MKFLIGLVLSVLILVFGSWVVYRYYPFIFSKSVVGPVLSIQKVDPGASVLTTRGTDFPSALFSFAVAVRDHKTREIFTSSTEDRAWATIEKGHCVEAVFFPHPPWNFEKSGTFQKARLERRFDCPAEMVENPEPKEN